MVERLNIGSFILCEKQRFLECLLSLTILIVSSSLFFLSSFLKALEGEELKKKKKNGRMEGGPKIVESTRFIESFVNQIPGHVPCRN